MTKALTGVRILDFTHVQSGPTCTQLLAWFGADVIKVERPGVGDITRGQLQDVPNVDSLYFTMLNHNKRSITLDTKNPKGKEVLTALIKKCDVLVENFGPGVLDRMGFPWEKIQQINPQMIVASIKGFGPGPYEDCKVYENVAQCTGGAASTTGFRDDVPLVTGAQIGNSGTGLHLALGIVTALFHRTKSGKGQRVTAAMQDGVLNLCRVKLRDQQRLAHGPLKEYSQFGEGIPFGDAVPRAGNDSGGGQPGRILKCKGWETDPNAYIYFITQAPVWEKICDVIGEPTWKTDPNYAKPPARLPRLNEIFARIEQWTTTKTKFEAMEILNQYDIPCGPILSMKELAEDQSLRATGTVVEVDHPTRGKYLLGRQPDQALGQPERGAPLAAARRAHRRGSAPGAGLQRSPGRRDPRLRRTRPAAEAGGRVRRPSSWKHRPPGTRCNFRRGHHVQDCFHRNFGPDLTVGTFAGHDRSAADEERRDLDPQRRLAALRPLRLRSDANSGAHAVEVAPPRITFSLNEWPLLRGHFFSSAMTGDGQLRQSSSKSGPPRRLFASWYVAYLRVVR